MSGKNIDILSFHKNMRYTGFPLRYQYTVIELKRDNAKIDSISQVIDYSKWVSTRLANSEIETVQPIIIASGFDEKSLQKARLIDFNNRKIKLFAYSVINSTDLSFKEIDL